MKRSTVVVLGALVMAAAVPVMAQTTTPSTPTRKEVHDLRREFVALYVQPINLSGRNVGTIEFRRDKTFERGFTPWQMRMA